MSRPGVVLLITTGVVIANYYYGLPTSETSRDLTEITRISIAPDRDYRSAEIIPTFAPTAPAFREVISDSTGEPEPQPIPKPGTWTTVVTAGRSVVSPVRPSRPSDPATRSQLAEDLQRELQRVGCYRGEITGSWNASTRHAMSAFMDRANAVLPFNQPDYVLLALVQSHSEVTCAAACPTGQSAQDDGRCVPAAVIAQASKRQKRLEARQLADARAAKKRADEKARDRVVATTTAQPEVLPWLRNQVAAEPLGELTIASRPDPLPGRMSIGGPLPPPDAAPSATAMHSLPPVVLSPNSPAKLASLQAEPDADDLSNDAIAPTADVPDVTIDPEAPKAHKSKRARHADRDTHRRRESYAYSGYSRRRRHGDPNPGTTRYNLMQSLGGIY